MRGHEFQGLRGQTKNTFFLNFFVVSEERNGGTDRYDDIMAREKSPTAIDIDIGEKLAGSQLRGQSPIGGNHKGKMDRPASNCVGLQKSMMVVFNYFRTKCRY